MIYESTRDFYIFTDFILEIYSKSSHFLLQAIKYIKLLQKSPNNMKESANQSQAYEYGR